MSGYFKNRYSSIVSDLELSFFNPSPNASIRLPICFFLLPSVLYWLTDIIPTHDTHSRYNDLRGRRSDNGGLWGQSDAFSPFISLCVTQGNPWLNLRGVTGEMWGSEHRYWRLWCPLCSHPTQLRFYFCLHSHFLSHSTQSSFL